MITLLDSATKKIAELVESEGDPTLKLRISVSGGGCSGFRYDFSFDHAAAEDDFVIEQSGVTVLIDALSNQYLDESTIDYVEEIGASQFVIRNPNVTSTCGCGSSFSA